MKPTLPKPRLAQLRNAWLLGILVVALLGALPTEVRGQDARRDLARIRAEIRQELRARPEVRAALEDWAQARSEYEALKQAVTYELTRDSIYLALRAEMWATEDELAALQHRYRNGVVPIAEVEALAQQILELRQQMSRLELEALARQGDLLEARDAYVAAGRRLVELRREMAELLRADPRLQRALTRIRAGGQAGGLGSSGGVPGRRTP